MVSATASQTGSNYSSNSGGDQAMTATQQKPAKLAIQTPTQKIIRLTRKQEHSSGRRGRSGIDDKLGNGDQDWRTRDLERTGPRGPECEVVCFCRVRVCVILRCAWMVAL